MRIEGKEKHMKKMTKAVTILTLLLTLALAVPVTGKAASPKAQVVKIVQIFFRAGKKLNIKKMEKCITPHTEFIFQVPYMYKDILRPYCRKMTWKIKNCKVQDNRAVVRMRVDYESIKDSYWYAMDDNLHYAIKHPNGDLEKAEKRFRRYLRNDAAKYGSEGYYYGNLPIHLRKINGKWKITEPVEELLNIVSCGYLDARDDFFGTDRWEN